jgi:hypothetical protein
LVGWFIASIHQEQTVYRYTGVRAERMLEKIIIHRNTSVYAQNEIIYRQYIQVYASHRIENNGRKKIQYASHRIEKKNNTHKDSYSC